MLHGQVFVMTSQYEMPHWKIKDVHRRSLCFRYSDSKIRHVLKSEISSF